MSGVAESPAPSEVAAVAPDAAVPQAKAKAKGRPEGKATARPRIDIDEQIAEVNRLHEIMKKTSERSSTYTHIRTHFTQGG